MRLDLVSRLLLGLLAGLLSFAVAGLALRTSSTEIELAAEQPQPLPTQDELVVGIADLPAVAPPATSAEATPTPSATPEAEPITIAFAGDIHGEPPIDRVLLDGDNPLAGVADILQAADVTVVNLETAVGTSGSPAPKTFTFQADPMLLDRLADAGVDVVNLANNHGLDFGYVAADETVELAEAAGLVTVGYGEDAAAAFEAQVFDVDGRTVAVVGLSRVLPTLDWAARSGRPGMASAYEIAPAVEAVRRAAEQADHVVVTIHWGRERHVCPNGDQVALAEALVAAGADVVAGHHPHVLQGVVELDGAVVAYSMGNFVFYARSPATRQTGILTVELGAEAAPDWMWHPATIDSTGSPQPADSQEPILSGETLTATSTGPQCGPPSSDGQS